MLFYQIAYRSYLYVTGWLSKNDSNFEYDYTDMQTENSHFLLFSLESNVGGTLGALLGGVLLVLITVIGFIFFTKDSEKIQTNGMLYSSVTLSVHYT